MCFSVSVVQLRRQQSFSLIELSLNNFSRIGYCGKNSWVQTHDPWVVFLFQANRAAQADNFFDQLAAKYAKPNKGGKKKK